MIYWCRAKGAWRMNRRISCLVISLLCSLFLDTQSGAEADECHLSRVTQLDMSVENDKILVPVSIEGASRRMAIDTADVSTVVDPLAVDDLHLGIRRIESDAFFTDAGVAITQVADLHQLEIGPLHAANVRAVVWPSPLGLGSNVTGALGADLLHNYDVDIDFGTGKLSFFSKDHCPGKVIYWPAQAVAVVPMHVTNGGHIILPVAIDGHSFDAILDTGSGSSHITLEAAHNAFGLTANSPDMTQVGVEHGAFTVPIYRHTFKTLELNGITIGNPTFYLSDNLAKHHANQTAFTGSRLSDADQQNGIADVVLGVHELHNLHVYIAYGEQKIYVTPASPPPSVASASASGPATTPH